jgi:hypothetical protein
VTGFGVVAGVAALFFACGILTGVLGVLALSALRDHRQPQRRHPNPSRYARDQADTLDRPGWQEPRGPDETGEPPPP